MAYITDVRVITSSTGAPEHIIVLGTGGCAILGPDFDLRQFYPFLKYRSNPGLTDLTGNGYLVALERGNSVFMRPVVARSLKGELLWSTDSPLKPTDFAGLWIHAFARDGHARILVGVKGREQASVLDESGRVIDIIPWDRVNIDTEIVFADVNGDGTDDAVFGSGGALVARDSHGSQLFRVVLPTPPGTYSPFVSEVRAVEPASGEPPTFFVLFFSRPPGRSNDAVAQNFLVSSPPGAAPTVREIALDSPVPWAGLHASFGDGIGESRITTEWEGMGILYVRLWRPDGTFLGKTSFSVGYAPGHVAVYRAPGADHDSLLVGANSVVWRVDPAWITTPPELNTPQNTLPLPQGP